jgi:hypothetical protein
MVQVNFNGLYFDYGFWLVLNSTFAHGDLDLKRLINLGVQG